MRFDTGAPGPTAAEILRQTPEPELERILADYGEERHARKLAQGLTPIDIVVGGLAGELRRMAERAEDLHGIPCRCRVDETAACRDTETATHLYYIAQEAVRNAMRHAKPAHVEVDLSFGDKGLLTVRDDGTWPERSGDETGGAGLRIMRHRADILGATLTIRHDADTGTCIRCRFPLRGTAGT